jgi:DNA-binding MarR family transcriptional regulator
MIESHKSSKRQPRDTAACTCASLRKATRLVTQAYDEALAPTGLRATQFTVLVTLSKTGELPLTRLAEALVMDRTTLTRNLKPLLRDRLVRIDTAADQRVRRVALTDAGRDIVDQALPHWQAVQSRMVKRLGRSRWAGLIADLEATVALVQDG